MPIPAGDSGGAAAAAAARAPLRLRGGNLLQEFEFKLSREFEFKLWGGQRSQEQALRCTTEVNPKLENADPETGSRKHECTTTFRANDPCTRLLLECGNQSKCRTNARINMDTTDEYARVNLRARQTRAYSELGREGDSERNAQAPARSAEPESAPGAAPSTYSRSRLW